MNISRDRSSQGGNHRKSRDTSSGHLLGGGQKKKKTAQVSRDRSGRCGKMAAHGTIPGTGNNIKYSPGRDS